MRLANRTDYAIRAALVLAQRGGQGPVKVDEIGEDQGIPKRYLGAIMNQMRREGLVRARRGPEGGYELARPADQISLADVIRAVDGALTQVGGERPEALHYSGAADGLAQVWVAIRAAERRILEETTLAQVVAGELPPGVRALLTDPGVWK